MTTTQRNRARRIVRRALDQCKSYRAALNEALDPDGPSYADLGNAAQCTLDALRESGDIGGELAGLERLFGEPETENPDLVCLPDYSHPGFTVTGPCPALCGRKDARTMSAHEIKRGRITCPECLALHARENARELVKTHHRIGNFGDRGVTIPQGAVIPVADRDHPKARAMRARGRDDLLVVTFQGVTAPIPGWMASRASR